MASVALSSSANVITVAAGTYTLNQVYSLTGPVCLEGAGAAYTIIQAASGARHLIQGSNILQVLGVKIQGTLDPGSGGIVLTSSSSQGAFLNMEFYQNNATFGNGKCVKFNLIR